MSPSVIKIRSKASTAKPAVAAKPKTATKPATRKAAAKPATRAKAAAAKPTAKKEPVRRRPKIDPKVLAKFERELKAVGKKRDDSLKAHEAAVEAMFEKVQEAMDNNVPMSVIADSTGVSRQWLYKMSSFKGRENGNAPAKKRAPATKAAAKSAAAKSKPTPKATAGRGRVKIKV